MENGLFLNWVLMSISYISLNIPMIPTLRSISPEYHLNITQARIMLWRMRLWSNCIRSDLRELVMIWLPTRNVLAFHLNVQNYFETTVLQRLEENVYTFPAKSTIRSSISSWRFWGSLRSSAVSLLILIVSILELFSLSICVPFLSSIRRGPFEWKWLLNTMSVHAELFYQYMYPEWHRIAGPRSKPTLLRWRFSAGRNSVNNGL